MKLKQDTCESQQYLGLHPGVYMTYSPDLCNTHILTTTVWIKILTLSVSEKKYDVADYQYFENGKTQQCDIFRLNKYNFEVSSP